MNNLPEWLPPLLTINQWTPDIIDILYGIFERDFKKTQPLYDNQIVWFFPEREHGREIVFWHLITETDHSEGIRVPDYCRARRLPWTRKVIESHGRPEILAWDYVEGNGSIKTYVWLYKHDYIVILKKYSDGSRRLLTAYCILFPNYRRKLKKKYLKRIL